MQNGISGKTKVSKLEISIDGTIVINNADFRKKVNIASKPLSGLTNGSSTLGIAILGKPGTFVNVLIEGTLKAGYVMDVEGNFYKTVTIDTQEWMAENLKTTKYNDGTPIPNVTDNGLWYNLSTPAYCWYENDASTYKATYGALYNWYTVITGNLCPMGWHVPSDAEWIILTSFLGGEGIAGGKLKEIGNTLWPSPPVYHWWSPNTGATNESGFTALPGGWRSIDGVFNSSGVEIYPVGACGYWLSSSERAGTDPLSIDIVGLYYWNSYMPIAGNPKQVGMSVRCVKDN